MKKRKPTKNTRWDNTPAADARKSHRKAKRLSAAHKKEETVENQIRIPIIKGFLVIPETKYIANKEHYDKLKNKTI